MKKTKYLDLMDDLKRSWKLNKIEVTPIIVGATGIVKKNLKDLCESIPGKPEVIELQLAAIIGTKTIIKRALSQSI